MSGVYKNNSTILTRSGWKGLEDLITGSISMGTNILSYDIKSGREEWTPLLGINLTSDSRAVLIGFGEGKEIIVSTDSLWVVEVDYPQIDAFVGEGLPDKDIRLIKTEELLPLIGNRYSYGSSMSNHIFKVRQSPFEYNIGMRSNQREPYLDTKYMSYELLDYNYETWSPITLSCTYITKSSEHIFLMGCYSDNVVKNNGVSINPLFLTSYTPGEVINIPRVSAYSVNGRVTELIILERPTVNAGKLKINNREINDFPYRCNIDSNLKFDSNSDFRGRVSIPYNVRDIENKEALIPSTITIQIGDITNIPTNTGEGGTIDFSLLDSLYQSKSEKNEAGGYVGLNSQGYIDTSLINVPALGIKVDWTDIPNDIELPYPPIRWEDILNKPDVFPTAPHDHPDITPPPSPSPPHPSINWSSINNRPTRFPPTEHNHRWEDIKNKPTNLLFKNDKISLLRNDIKYIKEEELEKALERGISNDIFSLEGRLKIEETSLNIRALRTISRNISVGANHIKILNSGTFFLSISLLLPLISLPYSYLTKYKITLKKGSFNYDYFCSSINTSQSINNINFNHSLTLDISRNTNLTIICSLQDEQDPSILPSFFNLIPSVNHLSLIKL